LIIIIRARKPQRIIFMGQETLNNCSQGPGRQETLENYPQGTGNLEELSSGARKP